MLGRVGCHASVTSVWNTYGRSCFLHSSSTCSAPPTRLKSRSKSSGGSQRRLSKDLKPLSAKGRLEVAPKEAQSRRKALSRASPSTRRPDAVKSFKQESKSLEDSRSSDLTPEGVFLNEFQHPSSPVTQPSSSIKSPSPRDILRELPKRFSSPPIMPGLVSCLHGMLGPKATPTPIQSLSLKWLLESYEGNNHAVQERKSSWKEFLLASETGSGKSIAYLLPMLQDLKLSEPSYRSSLAARASASELKHNPRALVLAPTHELSRQLSVFAKSLLHEIKLRVMCLSRANVMKAIARRADAHQLLEKDDDPIGISDEDVGGEGHSAIPVDIVVGTPSKLLDMVKGRGWDRVEDTGATESTGTKQTIGRPEMGFANVEWVVVDEADILLGPNFKQWTLQLLSEISAARGISIPSHTSNLVSKSPSPAADQTEREPFQYPFNFILSSATIPTALSAHLDKHHPSLVRLASPNLHHLPKTLTTEYVNWNSGNKLADIERRIRRVWASDAANRRFEDPRGSQTVGLSKILIFCNKSNKVIELGRYLEQKGIKNVAVTGASTSRKKGSSHHLDGFLRGVSANLDESLSQAPSSLSDPKDVPHVLVTTSLLSRGLDFSPSIRHVFIIDEPRNMVDFLHRAGRSGRAGHPGNVVVFGKLKGRGSERTKEIRRRVGALIS